MMAAIGLFLLWLTARQLRVEHLRERARRRDRSEWTRIGAYLPAEEREDA